MNPLRKRCLELLPDRATQDLDDARRRELDAILERHPEWDDEGFEATIAALDLAFSGDAHAMPPGLRRRLARTAQSWIDGLNR